MEAEIEQDGVETSNETCQTEKRRHGEHIEAQELCEETPCVSVGASEGNERNNCESGDEGNAEAVDIESLSSVSADDDEFEDAEDGRTESDRGEGRDVTHTRVDGDNEGREDGDEEIEEKRDEEIEGSVEEDVEGERGDVVEEEEDRDVEDGVEGEREGVDEVDDVEGEVSEEEDGDESEVEEEGSVEGEERDVNEERQESEEKKEQEEKSKKEQQIKRDPAVVPRRSSFFLHDNRFLDDNDPLRQSAEEDTRRRRQQFDDEDRSGIEEKWLHDLYSEEEQKPKEPWKRADYDERRESRFRRGQRGYGGNRYRRTKHDEDIHDDGDGRVQSYRHDGHSRQQNRRYVSDEGEEQGERRRYDRRRRQQPDSDDDDITESQSQSDFPALVREGTGEGQARPEPSRVTRSHQTHEERSYRGRYNTHRNSRQRTFYLKDREEQSNNKQQFRQNESGRNVYNKQDGNNRWEGEQREEFVSGRGRGQRSQPPRRPNAVPGGIFVSSKGITVRPTSSGSRKRNDDEVAPDEKWADEQQQQQSNVKSDATQPPPSAVLRQLANRPSFSSPHSTNQESSEPSSRLSKGRGRGLTIGRVQQVDPVPIVPVETGPKRYSAQRVQRGVLGQAMHEASPPSVVPDSSVPSHGTGTNNFLSSVAPGSSLPSVVMDPQQQEQLLSSARGPGPQTVPSHFPHRAVSDLPSRPGIPTSMIPPYAVFEPLTPAEQLVIQEFRHQIHMQQEQKMAGHLIEDDDNATNLPVSGPPMGSYAVYPHNEIAILPPGMMASSVPGHYVGDVFYPSQQHESRSSAVRISRPKTAVPIVNPKDQEK